MALLKDKASLKAFYGIDEEETESVQPSVEDEIAPLSFGLYSNLRDRFAAFRFWNILEVFAEGIRSEKRFRKRYGTDSLYPLTFMIAIKEIDSEMKAFVYGNYEKFITATDTLKKVFLIY